MSVKFRVIILLLLIVTLQLGLRSPFLLEPLERDEGGYGYMAERILAGEVPYRDVFDHKPPVVYYIYAAVVGAFGSSIFSLRVFTLIYGIFTTIAVFGIGYLILGSAGGLWSAFLYALFSAGPLIQGSSSNTETFMVLPLALALFCFLLARKKDSRILYFTAGLLSGLAFMIKQVAAFNFLVLLAFAIVEVKRPHPLTPSPIGRGRIPICNPFRLTWVRAFVVLLSGFFIIPAIFIIYFWLNGAGWDFINCVFFINQVYLAASPAPFFFLDPRYGWDIIRAQMTKENGILWLLSLASLFVIFLKDRKNELLLIAVWGLASFLGVSAGTLFFGHYFIQLIPAFCLLSAYALIKIKDEASFAARVILAILIGFVLLLNFQYQYPFYVKYNPYQINEMKYGTKTFGIARFAALDLSSRMSPNDDIFVWSAEPEIYFYLNRRAPGKYTYYFNWMKNLNIAGRILMDAKKQNPRFILWTDYAPSFPELEKWIKDDYTLREKHFNWILFERKK